MQGVDMTLSFGTEKLYENASFLIEDKDKVGVVGVNGAGKTTLFKVLLQEQSLDSGKVIIKNKRIGYLPQEITLEKDLSVWDYLMGARPISSLEKKLTKLYEKVAVAPLPKQPSLLKEIGKTQALLEYYDYYHAENILLEIVSSMHISADLLDMRLSDLSGGQKSKIAFAHLLYSNPEILLLDEPTNHLDASTRNYIVNYLKNYKGMVLVISHDTEFLDAIVNKILYIDKMNKKMVTYLGNYTSFEKQHQREKEIREKLIQEQEKEQQKLKDFILLYSNSSGKRKKIAQSREKLLEKKQKNYLVREKENKKVRFRLTPSEEGSKIPLKVNTISFGYVLGQELFHDLSFVISNRERFLIVGENGVGKSTLLKIIVGYLKPTQGSVWFGNKTRIAYYAQELELLNLDKTILENVDNENFSEKELRTYLGSFLFFGDDVFKKVAVLSPGEKARVALCKIMLQRANFLVLDEPTNHLDATTQEIIGQNFQNYAGTIILVSHNRRFASSIGIDRMLILPKGKIVNYNEELLDYYYQTNHQK